VGGLTIGYVGDKYGRKQALVLSLFLMAFPTFAMGCLPTYEQVGSLSTVLLVICRLLQGMSVGGQLPASLIYTVEMRPKASWGYYGALVMSKSLSSFTLFSLNTLDQHCSTLCCFLFAVASNCGTLLGNLVGAFMRSALTDEQLLSWGWRIPFLSGILIAFVAMYLRDHGAEHNPNAGKYDDDEVHSDDVSKQKTESKHLLGEVFKRENLPALGSATLTPMLWGAGFYTSFVWMAIYMKVLCNPPYEHAFWINAGALLFGIILPLPLTGMLSDKIGRDKPMGVGVVGLAIVGPLMIRIISSGNPVAALFAQWTLGVFLSLFGGPMNG
jgi:MHS family proline/betaine transporter-like MFS transporter